MGPSRARPRRSTVRQSWASAFVAVIAASLLLVGSPRPAAAATPFVDIDGHLFEADIEWLYANGITDGCDETHFCPELVVTREQMAAFLVRMFELAPSAVDAFDDDELSVFEAEINALAASGITVGCAPAAFCPMHWVRREEMASLIVRAAGLTAGAGNNYFRDDDGTLHEPDIDRAAAAGIVVGCRGWFYCPRLYVTRGAMAAFLHRVEVPLTEIHPFPAPPVGTLHVAVTGSDTDNDCFTEASPCRTIGHALGGTVDGDTIAIGPGTFDEEDLRVTTDITIRGEGAGVSIVDPGDDATASVFVIQARVVIEDISITNGVGGSPTVWSGLEGGGIINFGNLTVRRADILDNYALSGGGGIQSYGTLTIEDSTFEGNRSLDGGSITAREVKVTIANTDFLDSVGGAAVTLVNVEGAISGSRFLRNESTALRVTGYRPTAITRVHSTVFQDNRGPGIVTQRPLSIDRSLFANNTTGTIGGAVSSFGQSLQISNSTFVGNVTDGHGGAIYVNTSGTLKLTNVTITGNHAERGGGGIANPYPDAVSISVRNSLIIGNTSPEGPDVDGVTATNTASLIGLPAGVTLAMILSAAGLADNGGPTWTIALVNAGSNPAHDTANTTLCASAPVNGIDQRGLPRDEPCDMGAFEIQ